MKVLDLLKGKKIMVKTDVGAMVELEISEVVENRNEIELEPATRENDWWPKTESWTTYRVKFTNGHSKTYSSLDELNVY